MGLREREKPIRSRIKEAQGCETLAASWSEWNQRETPIESSMPPPSSSALGRRGGGEAYGILAAISRSSVAAQAREAAGKAKKLLRSTGKAAWIVGTTFLVLVVPLIIEMDREQQINDLELHQAALLGAPPPPPAK